MIPRATRWASRHPMALDVAFAVVIGTVTMIGHLVADVGAGERSPDTMSVATIVAQTACFAFRRRAPLRSVVGVAVFTVGFWVGDYATNFDVVSVLSVYAAVAHGGRNRSRVWAVGGSVVAFLTTVALIGVLIPEDDLAPAALIGIALIYGTAAITGEVVYDRSRRMRLLEERATRAEAERELLAREAVLAERGRIARDLHDIVAHAMSMMVVQAGAAERLVDRRPDRARQALADIQSTGREALDEMRHMVGVLRDGDDARLRPQPTIDDLHGVVEHCNEAGVPTELIIEGDPTARPHGVEMTGFRVVQEALTNVIKHAGRPARASVRVTYEPERLRLEVIDNGRGVTADELAGATGHGLVGMRERVEMYRGTFRAGPRPGGGFRVVASLPVTTVSGATGAVDRENGAVA